MKVETEFDKDLPIHGVVWTPATYVEPFHWHSCFELGFCISGKGWFYFGEKKLQVNKGDIFIVNNIERHIAQADSKDPCKFIFIFFNPSIIENTNIDYLLPFLYNPRNFKNRIPSALEVSKKIGKLMQLMFEELQDKNRGYKKIVFNTLCTICCLLIRHQEENLDRKMLHMLNGYIRIKPALIFLKEHFRESIELVDVANVLSLSPSRTRHLFKETIGETYKEHLLRIRINESKRLLAYSDYSITEICFQSGFQSQASFYRSFNSFVGISPQKFREQTAAFDYLYNSPEVDFLHYN